MKANVTIQVKDRRWRTLLSPHVKTVTHVCNAALGGGTRARSACEMAVVLADDRFIRRLNRDFRGKDKATNVLSFPGEGKHKGDVILAVETVKREAKAQGKKPRDHALHLLVHGTLHLLGYDHGKDKEAARMEALEIKILKKLGISNPYTPSS